MTEIFDKIADSVISLLPSEWQRVCLYANVRVDSYEIFFFVKINNEYVQCYQLPQKYSVSEEEIDSTFEMLYDLILSKKDNEAWAAFTLTFDRSGEFAVDYDYDGKSLDRISWLNSYLV